MKWSMQIAKVSGIKIYLHWTFFFLIAWALLANTNTGGSIGFAMYIVAFIACVFLCVILHELGHSLVAKRYGYVTKDITLLPIGGIARMDVLPESPKQELLIALAGPAVNFAIALVLWPIIYFTGGIPSLITILFKPQDSFLFDLFIINVSLGAFNLIPAFPMDGGRVLRALLAMRTTRIRATELAAHIGQAISVIFFFWGLFYGPMLAIIAIFVFLTAQAEIVYVRSHSVLHKYKVKDVVIHHYQTIDAAATIADAVKQLLDSQAKSFVVMEGTQVVGTLDRDDIIHALSDKGNTVLIKDVMKKGVRYVPSEALLEDVYKLMQVSGDDVLPVMDNNKLAGVIDLNNILQFIMINEAEQRQSMHHHSGINKTTILKPVAA